MKFANGYNLIYEKLVEEETVKRKLFASKTGRPEEDDSPIDLGLTDDQIAAINLVYEKDGEIMVSNTGLPSDNDTEIVLTINGEPVLVPSDTNLPEGAIVVATFEALAALKDVGGIIVIGADLNAGENDIVFTKDTTIDLNGHTITFDGWGIEIDHETLTIAGKGQIIAGESCLYAQRAGKLIVNGGTYTSTDNFVVGTHGSAGRGGCNITINAGTFNGTMSVDGVAKGYIACGLYAANDNIINIKGGTFNITDGAGIVARSGKTTVDANVVINATGNGTLGKVGDSQVVVPTGEALVLDLKSNYPGGAPTLVNDTDYTVFTIQPVAAATAAPNVTPVQPNPTI